jgi:hypothetical protein
MTEYALCPGCNNAVIDTGNSPIIECQACGDLIKSRMYGKQPIESFHRPQVDFYTWPEVEPDDEAGAQLIPDRFTATTGQPKKYRPRERHGTYQYRPIIGLLCTLAILCYFFMLVIYFIAFFPAIAITAPGLVQEHDLVLETELPLEIDNTSPNITGQMVYPTIISAGQLVQINVSFDDPNFKNGYVELKENNTNDSKQMDRFPFIFNEINKNYTTQFQAPINPGMYIVRIIALDHAGNSNQKTLTLDVIANSRPILKIEPAEFSIINSSSTLAFNPRNDEQLKISNIVYFLDGKYHGQSDQPSFSIQPSNWSSGPHILNLSVESSDSGVDHTNLQIILDNTKPKLTKLELSPLTINRNRTFRGKLNDDVFYRGELVTVNISILEQHLDILKCEIAGQEYQLIPVSNPDTIDDQGYSLYQTIIPLPDDPGKYKMEIFVSDLAGNYKKLTEKITVARVNFDYFPVPILDVSFVTENHNATFPMVNSEAYLNISMEYGDITELTLDTDDKHQTRNFKINDPGQQNLSDLPEGQAVIVIRAQVSYQYFDYIFFSLPIPPYLFVLPILISGWALFGLFIFIAVAVISSFIYLFKSSGSNAFQILKQAVDDVRAPMMQSNNSLIILAQLFLAVISFNVIYNWLLSIGRVTTHTPDFSAFSNWAFIYNLTSAAVYEELISRILLIGIPLFIIHLITGKLKDKKRNYILGGGFEVNKLTFILIAFSAITFGLAHAPGWDYWKVLPTLVSGFALGYLFVRKGIFLAILLHFSINFMSVLLLLLDYSILPSMLFLIVFYFWVFVGVIYFGYYLSRVLKAISKKLKPKGVTS